MIGINNAHHPVDIPCWPNGSRVLGAGSPIATIVCPFSGSAFWRTSTAMSFLFVFGLKSLCAINRSTALRKAWGSSPETAAVPTITLYLLAGVRGSWQWAAVRQCRADSMDAPQMCWFRYRRLTWCGACCMVIVWPPTIRSTLYASEFVEFVVSSLKYDGNLLSYL